MLRPRPAAPGSPRWWPMRRGIVGCPQRERQRCQHLGLRAAPQNRPATTRPACSGLIAGTTESVPTLVDRLAEAGVDGVDSSYPSTAPASISGGPTHISRLALP